MKHVDVSSPPDCSASQPVNVPIQVHLTQQLLAVDALSVVSGPTRRPAAVVLWASNGRPFKLSNPRTGVSWEGAATVVAPHYVRGIHAVDCELISLNFEPGHPYFPWVCQQAAKAHLPLLNLRLLNAFSKDLHAAIASDEARELDKLANAVVCALEPHDFPRPRGDARIRDVIDRLEAELSSPPSVPQLARSVGLSNDRLSHLFVEQVGLPVRSYIVWRRYRRAVVTLQRLGDLTAVAHAVGFYDHAQMTRTFVEFFGYLPSALRQPKILRVHS